MARIINRLSDRTVKTVKRPGYHPDGAGLYLQVSPAHTKSWIFRYTRHGKTREMGLGSYLTYSLEEARERAREQRKLLDGGMDPIDARGAQREQESARKADAMTFAECAERYIAANRAGWKNEKHAGQWQSTIDTYAGPIIGQRAVQDVDTGQIMRILEPIWTKKPETANRLRGRIERVLDWARVMEYRTGENPARWRGHLDKLLPRRSKVRKVQHHPALPYEKVGAFVQDLRALPGIAPQALEFTILTAARTGEVIGAKPEEFDLAKGVWTIPAARMKAKKEHRVPLSPRAVAIVKAQSAGDYVFRGRHEGDPLSNMAMLEVVRGMGREDLTVHGFRSTFRDWAGETTTHPREVIEHALAHQLKDKAEAAYQRGDLFEKRRSLMDDWARYCNAPKHGGKVVPIRKKA